MRNQHKDATGVKNGLSGFVILLSPGLRCWKCERLLPGYPSAVSLESNFEGEPRNHLFVVCSEYCGAKVRSDLARTGLNPQKISVSTACRLLRQAQNQLVAVIESWLCDDRHRAMVYRGVPAVERLTEFFAELN